MYWGAAQFEIRTNPQSPKRLFDLPQHDNLVVVALNLAKGLARSANPTLRISW